MKKIVLFASGAGTNAENIILHFQHHKSIQVAAVFSNNPEAMVLQRAAKYHVPAFVFSKAELQSEAILKKLADHQPDLIVLAGFLLQFPSDIIKAYPNRIINIHPALLPKYGGKGMYGIHVHRAILENKETETGISIHYVDEHYDEGDIIFQKKITLEGSETAERVAEKVHQLEQECFPKVIEQLLTLSKP